MADPGAAQRRLSAILSADAVGYARLMADDELATLETLKGCRDVMAHHVDQHGGRVVDAVGDNLLAEFPSVVEAITCAVEIQRDLSSQDRARPLHRRMPFRVGVNLGDVMCEAERIYGDGVNIAARVEGLAEPGGICVSGSAFDQVEGKLHLRWDALGEHVVKNLPRPVRVYRIKLGTEGTPPVAPRVTSDAGPPSIAILPLVNLSGDESDVLSDGMTEDLITLLSRVPGFFLIARSSTFAYKGKSPDVRQVGRDLGVRYVVEGSVRKLRNRIRVTVQLLEAESGRHLWAEKYDRPLEEIFELQDEVTEGIAAQLQPQLIKAEVERADRLPTASVDAWSLYQRALLRYLSTTSSKAWRAAIELCEQALDLDPDYPHALALRGALLADRVFLGWSEDPDRERAEALADGRSALERAPDDPAILYHWGAINAQLGEVERGISSLERSLELNPNNAHVCAVLGAVLAAAERLTEGVERIERAMRLSPRDPHRHMWHLWLGMAHGLGNRFDEALGELRKSTDLFDGLAVAWMEMACVLARLGEHRQARVALERAQQLEPVTTLEGIESLYRMWLGFNEQALKERMRLLSELGLR
jgi:adenylate cyclase